MFTGIVEAVGDVVRAEPGRLWVRSPLLRDAEVGASVSVSGVCLTVTETDGDTAAFDVHAETRARTALDGRTRVNLERPLRAGAELGGHFVQGHVDGVARVVSFDGERLAVEVDRGLARYVVEKGSVALDGCSLTVAAVDGARFEVALIPHTLAVTTFGDVRSGDALNVEVDVLAKYVERLVVERSS